MATTDKKVTLLFDYDQETKNTARFIERSEDDHLVGKIYVQKSLLETWGNPKTVRGEFSASKD